MSFHRNEIKRMRHQGGSWVFTLDAKIAKDLHIDNYVFATQTAQPGDRILLELHRLDLNKRSG